MFKDIKIKNILPTLILTAIFVWIMWFVLVKQGKLTTTRIKNKPNPPVPVEREQTEVMEEQNYAFTEDKDNLLSFLNLEYEISTKGKKAVFPIIIEKITDGPIELPNRRSLLNKDAKYKFIDIMKGQKIKAVSIQNLTYTVDHNVFNDNFLVTDNDYLIAYSQAKEHFKLA